MIAGTTNLVVWVGLHVSHVSEALRCAASICCAVNVGAVLLAWSLALMGVLELACVCTARRRGGQVSVITPAPFLPILVFLRVVWILSKEGGAYSFNRRLDGHAACFR